MLRRSDFYEASRAIFDLAENKAITACVSAVSMTDIFYILRKFTQNTAEIYAIVNDMVALFSTAPVTENTITGALSLRWKDFEDAVQYMTAQEAGAEYIITRNKSDFETSTVPADGSQCVSPSEFIALFTKPDKT